MEGTFLMTLGVWLILALVMQILVDAAALSAGLKWVARVCAPLAAVLVSGGFFGVAFAPSFRWLIYLGALSLAVAVLVTGVGLLKKRPA